MEIAALVMWVLTAVAGLNLLYRWLSAGGLRRQGTKVTRFPSVLVLGHPAPWRSRAGRWVVFVVTASSVYAWSAFGALVLVALLGFTLLTRWLGGGRQARARRRAGLPGRRRGAARRGLASLTFVLVLLTAISVEPAGVVRLLDPEQRRSSSGRSPRPRRRP